MISAHNTPRVHSSRYMGYFPQTRTPRYLIAGQDGGQSIPLGPWGGRTLFLFSDTLLLAPGPHSGRAHAPISFTLPAGTESLFLANCAAVAQGSDLRAALASMKFYEDAEGLPMEILKPDNREIFRRIRFWPEHGICWDGRVFFYYLAVQTIDPSSIWGFRVLGAGVAELNLQTGATHRIAVRGDMLPWRNPGADFHFGVHVVPHDGWVYVFGSARDGIQSTARVARVRPACMAEPELYEYLSSSGPTWSSHFGDSCSLGPAAAEYSVSWNAWLEKYAMIYVEEYSKRVLLRTADHLWGPYREPLDLIGVPHQQSSALVYLGFEHAGFRREDGRRIFLSYCEPHFSPGSLLTLRFDQIA
ncbi:MAG TPA: DUF4185 domain-containing protein [Bryobacteraceae bacterium]|nr:DUF4185 domain-containing protein [Bryobacteraceae bacterium]